MDQPQVTRDAARSRYVLSVGGQEAGHLQYEERGGAVALVHTEVDETRQEKGLGSTLVQGALDDLRDRQARIVPECPFVRRWLERHPDYAELVVAGG